MKNVEIDHENPQWTEADFANALYGNDIPAGIRKAVGRPAQSALGVKTSVSLRLAPEVLAYFRATGKGWQTRINAALKEWIAGKGNAKI